MTHGEIALKEPRTYYWLWPLATIFRDDIGWLVRFNVGRRTIRILFGRR